MIKKLFGGLAVIGMAMAVTGCNLSAPTFSHLETPDAAYEVDTWGSNSEVYEFTPQTAKGKTCVMLMLDSGRAMGLECFDK